MIVFDTQATIYAVQSAFGYKPADPKIAEIVKKGTRYLLDLQDRGEEVVISAITAAEYLAFPGFNEEQRTQQQRELETRFRIEAFDHRVIPIAAELAAKKATLETAADEAGTSRQVIYADLKIYATAVACKADLLVTYDKGLQSLAKRFARITYSEFPGVQRKLV